MQVCVRSIQQHCWRLSTAIARAPYLLVIKYYVGKCLQVLRNWRAVQKDAADARLLRELQLMHQASLHHRKMLGLRSLHGWAEAAAASREEAAAQARKDATWDKIQQWLAEDTGRGTSSEAILAPPFLQVVSYASPSPSKLIDTVWLHMQTTLYYGRLRCIRHMQVY